MAKLLISHTQLAAFTHCRQQWFYRYDRRIYPVMQSRAIHIGRLVDSCMNMLHSTVFSYAAAEEQIEADIHEAKIEIMKRTTLSEADEQTIWWAGAQAKALIKAYIDLNCDKDPFSDQLFFRHPWDVVMVQGDLTVPLPVPGSERASTKWDFRWKPDMVVRINGELVLVENKTMSMLQSDYLDRNDQVLRYLWAMQQGTGEMPRRVIVNCFIKPSHKPGTIKGWTTDGHDYYRIKGDAKAAGVDPATLQPLERPETAEEYQQRVLDIISADPEKFIKRLDRTYPQAMIDEAGERIYRIARDTTNPSIYRSAGVHCNWCDYKQICNGELTEEQIERDFYSN